MLNVIKTENLMFHAGIENNIGCDNIGCYIIMRTISLEGITLLEIIVWGHKGGPINK